MTFIFSIFRFTTIASQRVFNRRWVYAMMMSSSSPHLKSEDASNMVTISTENT